MDCDDFSLTLQFGSNCLGSKKKKYESQTVQGECVLTVNNIFVNYIRHSIEYQFPCV